MSFELKKKHRVTLVAHAMQNGNLFNNGQTEILHKENHIRKRLNNKLVKTTFNFFYKNDRITI